ncbi:hypothetical protein J9102_004409 [Vibrio vulnificus]|nr:hypothetical protein [Vibrio vulnificus]EME0812481.1 hypothetical protein [Vibrio vulnificus]
MENIEVFAEELEDIILENLDFGLFNIELVQSLWTEKHPDVDFQKVIQKLVAENKVGAASKTHGEYRDPERTD